MFKDVIATSVLVVLAAASPIVKRDVGPSGKLITPSDSSAPFFNPSGTGLIPVQYTTVNQQNDTDYYMTAYIDITLEPIGNNGDNAQPITIAKGLMSSQAGETINAQFAGGDACGDYRFTVTEYQIHNMGVISFKSQSPKISIACGPIQ